RTRFPCAFSAAGETRRETLLRKAPESTAHVAGFGVHSEGCGPPNLPEGFVDSLTGPRGSFRSPAGRLFFRRNAGTGLRVYLPAFFTALSAEMRPHVAHRPWPMPPMVLWP